MKIPGVREERHRNGHKVQLALKRRIQELEGQLERAEKQAARTAHRQVQLENRLLFVETDRARLKAGFDSLEGAIADIERVLGLGKSRLNGKERTEQLLTAVRSLREDNGVGEPLELASAVIVR